jgi:hypothetical protein
MRAFLNVGGYCGKLWGRGYVDRENKQKKKENLKKRVTYLRRALTREHQSPNLAMEYTFSIPPYR